ncbi:MAG: peptide-methionine (S)-S-oxide reductase MsrA [Alphaproteobacteria bacterium]|nr:peptide-methionine (S)-S-oxide reductase MsrA [Alphaproteobacteria bacterium]
METQEAIFAMGCFWCGAAAFKNHDTHKKLPGIIDVKSGYTGGRSTNPTYESHAGHLEAVKIVFDSSVISYEKLLDIFWHNIDPFDDQGQFCDKGFSYKAAIFFKNEEQEEKAKRSIQEIQKKLGKNVVTSIIPASVFYNAEEYHQEYHLKNPVRYKFYRWNCGRDKRLNIVWGL